MKLLASEEQPDLGEALQLALVAKEGRPEDPHIADTLGWLHYLRGAYDLALAQFTFAADKVPDNPTIRYHLALVLEKLGRTAEARAELERCLASKEEFPERQEAKALLASLGQG